MLIIPDVIWDRLLDAFGLQRGSVERVAYLDGIRAGESKVVTTITVPDAELRRGSYAVGTEAASQAGRAIRAHGLERLAQVHTHPNDWLEHSKVDDLRAYSHRPGAISIVLPDHARNRPTPIEGAGVHLRQDGEWRLLSLEESQAYVRVVPSLLDFRVKNVDQPKASGPEGKSIWRPFWHR